MSLRKLYAPALLFSLTLLFAPCALAQADARAQAAADIESLREQIKAKEAVLLAPSDEDWKTHAEFLAQPRTGLMRLLPRERWTGKLSTRGDGAYYSFARRTQEYGYGSDISLEQDAFSVGFAGADFGFMVNLGNVPLETLTADAEAVQFMASYRTPSEEPEARKAHAQFSLDGDQTGRWAYKSRLPVFVNNTYALRSVNYNYSDVLVAFRVVRKDLDGSAVILWKLLAKYPKPALQRNVAAAAAGQ
ncbi:MAG TPA: hypothetical protein VM914_08860 [Pyrinomonadaceae bacterium]|jgi:hypothetical protein|nr:hypothetical protein [Pyrinomonadaceae bacterium]